MAYTPSLEEVITMAVDAAVRAIHGPMPCRVVSVNHSDNTVDVQVMTRIPVEVLDTGETDHEDLPIIPAVPIMWLRSSAAAITIPIAVGDTGLLVPLFLSAARWLATGDLSEPGDVRTNHVANAVFIPGFCPKAQKPPSAATAALVLEAAEVRAGNGATRFVALENLVNDELNKIRTTLNSATAAGGGAAVVYGTPYTVGSVACTKLKAE